MCLVVLGRNEALVAAQQVWAAEGLPHPVAATIVPMLTVPNLMLTFAAAVCVTVLVGLESCEACYLTGGSLFENSVCAAVRQPANASCQWRHAAVCTCWATYRQCPRTASHFFEVPSTDVVCCFTPFADAVCELMR